mgnify:CR=1 FL=1
MNSTDYHSAVELSDEFVFMKHNGELYAELAIPVKRYRKQLKTMLHNLMVSRELYDNHCMIDIKADMSKMLCSINFSICIFDRVWCIKNYSTRVVSQFDGFQRIVRQPLHD